MWQTNETRKNMSPKISVANWWRYAYDCHTKLGWQTKYPNDCHTNFVWQTKEDLQICHLRIRWQMNKTRDYMSPKLNVTNSWE